MGERPPFPFPGCWMSLESIPIVHIAEAAATEGQSAYLGENRSQSNGTGPIDHIGLLEQRCTPLSSALTLFGFHSHAERYPNLALSRSSSRTRMASGSRRIFLHLIFWILSKIDRLVRFNDIYTSRMFSYEWIRIYLYSGLEGANINKQYIEHVEQRILWSIRAGLGEFNEQCSRIGLDVAWGYILFWNKQILLSSSNGGGSR